MSSCFKQNIKIKYSNNDGLFFIEVERQRVQFIAVISKAKWCNFCFRLTEKNKYLSGLKI
jgi:hypothetical protein